MKILAIDYGKKKIGLAFAESFLAEPLKTLRFQNYEILIGKLQEIITELKAEKIVMGISEGEMAKETKKFVKSLKEKINIPVIFQDETLTTVEAQELSIKAGIKRKKRKEMEDAYSAALILQAYLDK